MKTGNRIEEGKLIAEFMELELTLYKDLKEWMWVSKHDGLHSLKYHSSWDWLMPVVEKIEAERAGDYWGFSFQIRRKYVIIYAHEKNKQDSVIYQSPWNVEPQTKIKEVYDAVVQFILWYNQKK